MTPNYELNIRSITGRHIPIKRCIDDCEDDVCVGSVGFGQDMGLGVDTHCDVHDGVCEEITHVNIFQKMRRTGYDEPPISAKFGQQPPPMINPLRFIKHVEIDDGLPAPEQSERPRHKKVKGLKFSKNAIDVCCDRNGRPKKLFH